MKPAAWLQDGDLVVIEIEKIGKIANKMVFQKEPRAESSL
jgi:2-keto-4-pentenoate hydratase/2-oxohepta-3-ene-1,7-dioic acid hydratase in catechol pathway